MSMSTASLLKTTTGALQKLLKVCVSDFGIRARCRHVPRNTKHRIVHYTRLASTSPQSQANGSSTLLDALNMTTRRPRLMSTVDRIKSADDAALLLVGTSMPRRACYS